MAHVLQAVGYVRLHSLSCRDWFLVEFIRVFKSNFVGFKGDTSSSYNMIYAGLVHLAVSDEAVFPRSLSGNTRDGASLVPRSTGANLTRHKKL